MASHQNSPEHSKGVVESVVVLALTVIVSLLFWPVILDIWRYSFDDGTYSHAFLIPFVALYVLYDIREQLQFRSKPNGFTLILVFLLMVELCLYLGQISLPVRALLPLVLLSALLSIFVSHKGLYLYALVFLFITPIWGLLSPPLQQLSTTAVETIMAFTGIPSYFEGNIVSIPSGQFEIANGCSGLRYFITSLFLCLLFVYFNLRSARRILLFFIITMAGALLVNWIRIITIIFIGHLTNMQSSIVGDHNNLGWYVYAPYLLMIFYVGNSLAKKEANTTEHHRLSSKKNIALKPIFASLFALILLSPLSLDLPVFDAETLNSSNRVRASDTHGPLQISRYSELRYQLIEQNDHQLSLWYFTFSGYGLDNKASYFNNSIIPDGMRIETKKRDAQTHSIYFLAKNNQPAVLVYAYLSARGLTSSLKQQKQNHLLAALSGHRESAILVGSSLCNATDCRDTLGTLQQMLSQQASTQYRD